MKKLHFVINSLAVMLLGASFPAMGGEIYSYTDAHGVIHFTSKPPKTNHRITVKYYPEKTTVVAQPVRTYKCSPSNKSACFPDQSVNRQTRSSTFLGSNRQTNQSVRQTVRQTRNSTFLGSNRPKIYTFLGSNGEYSFSKDKSTAVIQQTKIYKCVKNGEVAYTDKPNSRCKLIYRKRGIPIASYQTLAGTDRSIPLHKKYEHYQSLIQEVAASTSLEPALLHAVIQTESAFNPKAVSPKGAVGLMQLMPATAKRFGVTDRTDATSNVYGGARYLRYLLGLFNNNMKLALAGYNAGENAVKRYGNKIPPYRETKGYVKKVMRLYRAYKDRI
jgi:hypothetical protein